MSQASAHFVPLQDKKWPVFTGGLVTNSEANVIPYQNTPLAYNFRVNAGGISIRPWFYTFKTLTGTWSKAFGITNYTRVSSANNRLVFGYKADSTHYLTTLDSSGNQVDISTSTNITSENRMRFLPANDAIYCMNWVDSYGKLSWTTYTVPSTGIATFKPAFGVYWNNCGWVSGNTADPTKLYKSAANNLDTYGSTAWTDQFTSPYPISGLWVNQQSLYVFTRYSIDVFNTNSINQVASTLVYQSKPLEATEGCANHDLIVSVGKGIFYISPSNKVRMISPNSFGMYDFTEVSHRAGNGITKTMEDLDPNQDGCFWYAIPKKQIICWHMKSKGATYNDTVIVYHYEYDEWMVDTNKSFGGGTLFDSVPYTISAVNPTVFYDEVGTTDDDSPIQFRYDTKDIDLGDPTILKCLWMARTFIKISPKTKIYQRIYADGALVDEKLIDNTTIPQSKWGIGTLSIWSFAVGTEWYTDQLYNTVIVRDKGYLRIKAKRFSFSYVSYESGSECLIQRLEPQMEQLHWLTTSHF